jgi:hypothetical protein
MAQEEASMMNIVSLFDHTGQWPAPYKEAGYNVIQVDIRDGWDVLDIEAQELEEAIGEIHGVLAAPPCTDFSSSGAQYWPMKDKDGRTAHSVRLVDHTLDLIEQWNPVWWALENPVGRLAKVVPRIGKWKYSFNPCDFGDPYTKRTLLWGEFNTDLTRNPVEPHQGSKMLDYAPGPDRGFKRSVTPPGFARAFFNANP